MEKNNVVDNIDKQAKLQLQVKQQSARFHGLETDFGETACK